MADPLNASFNSGNSELSDLCDLKELVKLESNHVDTNESAKTSSLTNGPSSRQQDVTVEMSSGKPRRSRLMNKRGKCQVNFLNCQEKKRNSYIKDVFTTSVDMPWRYNIIFFTLSFIVTWLLFAGVYWTIAWVRGDFDHLGDEDWKPCFRNFNSFESAFLYSIETQTTIGYGFRSPTEQCGEAIFVVVFHTVLATLLEAFVIGSFMAKISRPKMRASSLVFSKVACITEGEDGGRNLTLRIGDIRKSPIVEGHVRILFVSEKVGEKGDVVPLKMLDLNMGQEIGADRFFLVWPLVISHTIDKESPLYDISPSNILNHPFELIVIVEGIVEATGTTTQARTSYTNEEIKWGYQFEELISTENGKIQVDISKFDHIQPIDMLNLSSKQMNFTRRNGNFYRKRNSSECTERESRI